MMIEIIAKQIEGLPVLEVVARKYRTQSLPLIVFYHGWTGCKERVLTEGYELAKRGFRVVLPDAKFHGQRQSGPVTGHRQEFWQIVASSVKELPLLVDYYRQTSGIKDDLVGVSGLSMGAITTCALLTVYDWIKAGVSLMGSPCPTAFARQLLEELPGLADIPASFVEQQLAQLELIDLSKHPERIAGRPVHFWHDTADQMVPYAPDKAFFDSIQGKDYARNTSFTTTTGQGHKVNYATAVEMAEKFEEYFGGIDDGTTK